MPTEATSPGEIARRIDQFRADAAGAADAPAMLVLPGGAYGRHAPHEGAPVASWLTSLGIHAFVFSYPVAPARHPAPVRAAAAALAWIRGGAHGLPVDPGRVGVIGFSAGGHLAASLCAGPAGDRPDRCVLGYPVISFVRQPHDGCSRNLLGPGPGDAARHEVSVEEHVDDRHPPTFLWHTAADDAVPAGHSLSYAAALVARGVPVDLHVFAEGRHGLGLVDRPDDAHLDARRWTSLCESWLSAAGWTP
ncbi:alpha/beta hydrolase [Jiangella rhizosphaerae]|uniref:alpha/beta hydrolase n=1 Tax=Jiangella rhizosphaerae TaxID=2293569 RepID=UPI0018F3F7F4|nr:alpha/beta hydrolase [Jiangella rhizosphaerae]